MSNVTLYLPEEVKREMQVYSEIRWSEIVRQAVIAKLKELKKLELLKKYIERQPFSQEDIIWMDENDWHPVDEKQLKLRFVDSISKTNTRFVKAKSVNDLFR